MGRVISGEIQVFENNTTPSVVDAERTDLSDLGIGLDIKDVVFV